MTDKVVLITGGAQGIGAATARAAPVAGYRVHITYKTSAAEAEALVSALRAEGAEAWAWRADASVERDVIATFDAIQSTHGRAPDALVNNAGITGRISRIEGLAASEFDAVMSSNVRSAFLHIREAARRMGLASNGRDGRIVNVSSRASELGGANEWVHYAASKGAMDSLTIGAARELAPQGIRVNAVSPGLIATDIHAKAGAGDRLDRLVGDVPLGRLGTAEEVANVILWLLSNAAQYVTGALIPVSGGR